MDSNYTKVLVKYQIPQFLESHSSNKNQIPLYADFTH